MVVNKDAGEVVPVLNQAQNHDTIKDVKVELQTFLTQQQMFVCGRPHGRCFTPGKKPLLHVGQGAGWALASGLPLN